MVFWSTFPAAKIVFGPVLKLPAEPANRGSAIRSIPGATRQSRLPPGTACAAPNVRARIYRKGKILHLAKFTIMYYNKGMMLSRGRVLINNTTY